MNFVWFDLSFSNSLKMCNVLEGNTTSYTLSSVARLLIIDMLSDYFCRHQLVGVNPIFMTYFEFSRLFFSNNICVHLSFLKWVYNHCWSKVPFGKTIREVAWHFKSLLLELCSHGSIKCFTCDNKKIRARNCHYVKSWPTIFASQTKNASPIMALVFCKHTNVHILIASLLVMVVCHHLSSLLLNWTPHEVRVSVMSIS